MNETMLFNGQTRRLATFQVAVDPEKFRSIIKERGLTQAGVGMKLGYSSHSISGALNAGIFSGPMVNGLRTVFGIEPEEYEYIPPKADEPEKEEEDIPKEEAEISCEETALYATMKRAMLDALAETTEFYGKFMHNVIKQAMCEALKG